jgi:hypothetical protein
MLVTAAPAEAAATTQTTPQPATTASNRLVHSFNPRRAAPIDRAPYIDRSDKVNKLAGSLGEHVNVDHDRPLVCV